MNATFCHICTHIISPPVVIWRDYHLMASFLKVAESEDIDEMIADIKMKKPHARMFKKGLAELLGGGPEEA